MRGGRDREREREREGEREREREREREMQIQPPRNKPRENAVTCLHLTTPPQVVGGEPCSWGGVQGPWQLPFESDS